MIDVDRQRCGERGGQDPPVLPDGQRRDHQRRERRVLQRVAVDANAPGHDRGPHARASVDFRCST
jgi:hypothetical protein